MTSGATQTLLQKIHEEVGDKRFREMKGIARRDYENADTGIQPYKYIKYHVIHQYCKQILGLAGIHNLTEEEFNEERK